MQAADETGALLRDLLAKEGKGKTRVLVADDDPDTLHIVQRSLEAVGHAVICASDGAHAYDAICNAEVPFDLVIIDAMMPKISGFDLCQRIRDHPRFNRLPVLMLTAMADKRSRMKAHSLGASEYITKPIDRVELATRVDHQLKLRDYEVLQREYAAKLEAEVETLTQTLFRTERLAFLGTVAGGVGHELNTLTTVMQSAVYFLEENLEHDEPIDPEILPDLKGVLEHLKNHGKQLLNLGRPSACSSTHSDLSVVLRECLRTLQMTGRTKYVEVVFEDAPFEAWVNLPRARVEQVFFNLIGNAVDAIGRGRDAGGRITIGLTRQRESMVVKIADNGSGMDAATQERIFEPYFTTKGPESGTGLGLVVVAQILETFGGHIEMYSTKGEGTVFSTTFPRLQPGAQD